MSVISFIEHYQRSIKKSDDDENRLLHCLEKLANLQVKVSDLQATGIGRTVNSLRKKPGKVGETVRSLVARWMEIVESHMTEDEEAQDHSGDEGNAKENGHSEISLERQIFSPDNSSNFTNRLDYSDKDMSMKSHHLSRKSGKESENKESKSKHRHTSTVDDKKMQESKHHSSSDHRHESSKSRHKSSRDDKDRHSSSSKRHRDDKSPKKIKKEFEEDNFDISSSKKPKISSSSEPGGRVKEETLSPEINIKKEKHRDSSVKVKKERSSPDLSRIKKEKSSPEEKVRIKREPSPERSSKVKKERSSPEPKVKIEKLEGSSKPSTSKKSSSSYLKKEFKDEGNSDDSDSDVQGNGGASFEDAFSYVPTKKSKDKKKSHAADPEPNGSSGKSFEDALTYTPTKKSKEKKKTKAPATTTTTPSNFKPLPRSEELASMLDQPALTYRPLPHVPARNLKPHLSEIDALSAVIGNKNQRTKVYSGTKAFHGEVVSLQDMCIKILQDNIDALEHVGSVPFFLLEPVFTRANANQLVKLEHFNPDFSEDFNDLWKSLTNAEFKTAIRQEYECWRDVYERALGERNDKMAQLAAKIKLNNEARKAPQRTTKLAFEHSLVKPPRNVRKQQEKHGTARGTLPAKRSFDFNEPGPSVGFASRDKESTLARTVGLLREGPGTSRGKKRPAPLMQKTLQLMKTNYRR